jgi:hypothetical protein
MDVHLYIEGPTSNDKYYYLYLSIDDRRNILVSGFKTYDEVVLYAKELSSSIHIPVEIIKAYTEFL